MQKTFIDKLAYIYIHDRMVLSTLSQGKDTWYIPGGKREDGESDVQALIREVEEELTVHLKPETIRHYGTFEAQAHGKPEGTIVRMTCYTAEFDGELTPSNEVEKMDYLGYVGKSMSSSVDGLIFDDLKSRDLID
jgi:8-oxo-dGTP pyrophosphatase MutT (NUDIX family)